MTTQPPSPCDPKARATRLGLWGLLARWSDVAAQPWLEQVLDCEEEERHRRSLERRLANAKIGRFKPLSDFDWNWPKKIDRELIEDLFSLDFIAENGNVVLAGPNGVGKTLIAQNLAYQAVLKGHTVRFITASELLNELAAHDSPSALARRLRCFSRPTLLVIDEVGYLSYNTRHADLLFDIVSRRHQLHSTVITTNRPFSEWHEVFPNASSVVALIDRLVHKAEVVTIDGESYRLKEAKERSEHRRQNRAARRKAKRLKIEEPQP